MRILVICGIAIAVLATLYAIDKSGALSTNGTTTIWATTSGTVATTVQSTTVATTVQSTTTIALPPNTLNGTFSYYPNSPVRVDTVHAVIFSSGSGTQSLYFAVGFTNTGRSPIYVIGGCGSSLSSNITSGNTVVETVKAGPRCLCSEGLESMPQGANHTSFDPGCWSGYSYVVRGSGNFTAKMKLFWYSDQYFSNASNTIIEASFRVP